MIMNTQLLLTKLIIFQLKSIALDYLNCDNSMRVKQLTGYLAASSGRGRSNLRLTENKCKSYIKRSLNTPAYSSYQSKLHRDI